jgi:hypothetical protein
MFSVVNAVLHASVYPPMYAPVRALVVGAGRSEELIRLGDQYPRWEFVGVDLSWEVLQLGERRHVRARAARMWR